MNESKHSSVRGNQNGRVISGMQWLLAGVVILLLLLAYWYFSSGAGFRGAAGTQGQTAPPTSREAVPQVAREVISEQQQAQVPDYAAALEQARSLRAEGKLADAQLLYFFAARGGYTPAAYELAELYDPLHFDATASLMDKPDPFQAFKWYQQASVAGNSQAAVRLEQLRVWAQQAAETGDLDADQLLLQWQ